MRSEKLEEILSELIFKKAHTIKKDENGTTLRLSGSIVWKDENGKTLTELEAKKMLDTQKYIPNLNTDKNIMVLTKKN